VTLLIGLAVACSDGGSPTETVPETIAITLSASSLEVAASAEGTVTVALTRGGGYGGTVALTVEGVPTGVTASFAPQAMPSGTSSSTLVLMAGAEVAAGTSQLTVRASGTGVADATATLALATTAAPPAGSFTLSISPSTLSIEQGQSGEATVDIERTGGFTAAVSLAVGGVPAGVTATVTPASAAGSSATVNLTASGTATVGSATLTVTGSAEGVADQTANLSLQVSAAPPPSGGVTWNFCTSSSPIWLAYQDGDGPWTPLPVAPGASVTIPVTAHGGVAFVTPIPGLTDAHAVFLYYATAAEFASFEDWCAAFGGGKAVSGSVAGLTQGDGAYVIHGIAGTFVDAASPNFTLSTLADGPRDLVASRQRGDGADRFIFRRAIDPAPGSILSTLDFGGSEAFEPVTRNVSVSNANGEPSQITLGYYTANRTNGILSTGQPQTSASHTYPGIPADRQAPGDLHQLIATVTSEGQTITQLSQRSTYSFFREATDRTVALGPDLSTPIVSIVAAAPYTRPRIQLARQVEYGQMISFQLQSGLSGAIFLSATAGYFGGNPATWDITVPDLTPAGFQPGWAPQPGGFGTFWFISGFGWQASGLPTLAPTDGLTLTTASRGGVIP
jgi:hypothetical protein